MGKSKWVLIIDLANCRKNFQTGSLKFRRYLYSSLISIQ
ncbi:hypothetical protein C943_01516 [Mariniradius saccharolyticus AK6]|uniref:Uncharacterized protein n=1 Tax=Mariniradius saccharolyticus AK6 TaxID=1239962 RepID=M7XCB6_9BACT|nr:hypothetical protein C943_01516 [Mariniradius saccharolyticus AK6]